MTQTVNIENKVREFQVPRITSVDLEYPYDFGGIHTITNGLLNQPALKVYVSGEDGFKVTEELKEGIEPKINEFFRDKGKELNEHFKSSPLWKDFAYVVLLLEPPKDGKVYNGDGLNYDSIVGLVLAFRVKTSNDEYGVEFMYYDTVAIDKRYRGKHLLKRLLGVANKYAHELDLPAALRASDDENNKKYSRYSNYPPFSKINGYWMHYFGFKCPFTDVPIKEHASKIRAIADYMANLPSKFRDVA